MQQAIYSPHNSGHFGLAYEAYTHFTSPIRRYPDLLVHRAIKACLATQDLRAGAERRRRTPPSRRWPRAPRCARRADACASRIDGELAAWEKLGLICSANERRADDASRDVEAWLKSYYMRERVGETYSGTVSSVVPFGVFVVLDDLYVEGLVHVSELGSEYFLFNEALHELRGERTGLRYRLGDRVTVQVARVDLEARRIEFRLVRGETRKAILAASATEPKERERQRGESVEERRERRAVAQPASRRDTDKRKKARTAGGRARQEPRGLRGAKSRARRRGR